MQQQPLNLPVGVPFRSPITSNTTTVVKTGGGTFHGFSVLTAGSAWTAAVYDGTSASGTLIAEVTLDATGPVSFPAMRYLSGLTIVTSGTTAGSAIPLAF